ncbi:CRISPR-associated helicase Cas3' [Saccharopolyspora elongata]|uniref:CRISPR-associated helicase Cas3 n=2 Tax=Saccharopolyspora elongata TaxID=2530387 RepID=A0A4V2YM84_9PSEU|nr:CRISPR-associated helicase Cas3' [Saccharopolyspora elongata]
MNLLVSHLVDAAAVGELLWDHFLAPSTRAWLDEVAGGPGRGRVLLAWLCGVHDCGKATPAHQRLWPEGARAVREAGLSWHEPTAAKHRWRHDRAGGFLLRSVLSDAGWSPEQVEWVWPLVAGHHGLFPAEGQLPEPRRAQGQLRGEGNWPRVQQELVRWFTQALGFAGVGAVQPVSVPSRAAQLHVSGLVVMADWIASDEHHFVGVDDLDEVSMEAARKRAGRAWAELGLRGGWGSLTAPASGVFEARFGHAPRDSQLAVLEAARAMQAPGLLVVEAPMGEGKTKAALVAAEELAARFGADGVFVGMPTQATSDPMFSQVRSWAGAIDAGLAGQVALLHGKRMFNKEWTALLAADAELDRRFAGVDEYGMHCGDDEYGLAAVSQAPADAVAERQAPAQWFLGSKRGLLCPFVVGTIDQLLFAATRTKHVMLRTAGLAGKVVILDEVHAADVYMSQFLREGLRWLGQAGVPVVLLSATLPPSQRREFIDAYLLGAASKEEAAFPAPPEPVGYPRVTAAWLDDDRAAPRFDVREAAAWRPDVPVEVEILSEQMLGAGSTTEQRRAALDAGDRAVADLLEQWLAVGGCALVIRNTVARAQSTFAELQARFGDDVRLLHARLTVQARADRTEDCLQLLGPPPKPGDDPRPPRPARLILVATQLAEQSFDVDTDLLVTDLAPIDLLLQRIGRLHRHAGTVRPSSVEQPRVVVTGFDDTGDRPPRLLYASEKIYGRYLLLRTAAEVSRARETGWRIPTVVPELVDRVYSGQPLVPEGWVEAETAARTDWEQEQSARAAGATPFLLTRLGEHEAPTLEGLHSDGVSGGGSESLMEAVVRDGERGVEVILVVADGDRYRTLAGRALGPNGEVPDGVLDEVLGATVRLPPTLSQAAVQECRVLPGWQGHPWLRYSLALELDGQHRKKLGETVVRYDTELGLVEETKQ